jgi:hypothetical protein
MKASPTLVLLLALPLGLVAQQPSTTPQVNPVTTVLRTRTATFHRNLEQAFDSIPESKFAYKPTPAQMTIGDIAQHLASDNYFYCDSFGTLKGTPSGEETSTADSVKAKWPKAKLMAQLKASFAYCENASAQLDDAKLGDPLTVTVGGQSRNIVRANRVIGHLVDVADHYSQIANYMRLNNMLPPTALPRPGRGGF